MIAIAFLALVIAHLTSDFPVLNVAENSMPLWVLILAAIGALAARRGHPGVVSNDHRKAPHVLLVILDLFQDET